MSKIRLNLIGVGISVLLGINGLFCLAAQADNRYERLVNNTISAHNLATDYLAWKTSGVTPEDIYEETLSCQNPSQEFELFCKAVQGLSTENASLFTTVFRIHNADHQSQCGTQILESVEEFYKNRLNEIKFADFDLFNNYIPFQTLKPSQELFIDTTNGPRFVTADLPEKNLAFTFDDGPHKILTHDLLEILERQKIKATFFMVGQNVLRYPSIARSVADSGHTIGTHSWSHKQLPKLSQANGVNEIDKGFLAAIDELDLVAPFFRFPYGARSHYLKNYLKSKDISSFFWNIDTLDWKIKDPAQLYQFALSEILKAKRGIVLFHDVQPQTIAMLPRLFWTLRQKGFESTVFRPQQWLSKQQQSSN